MPPSPSIRREPTLHLHIANWIKFTAGYGLDTCVARSKAINVGRPHLSELERPTPDGLSEGPVGTRFLAALMIALPKARNDFAYLFVPLSVEQKLARRPVRRSA